MGISHILSFSLNLRNRGDFLLRLMELTTTMGKHGNYYSVSVSQASPMQFGFSVGFFNNFNLIDRKYNLHPTQIPNAVSRNSKARHIKHKKQTGSK